MTNEELRASTENLYKSLEFQKAELQRRIRNLELRNQGLSDRARQLDGKAKQLAHQKEEFKQNKVFERKCIGVLRRKMHHLLQVGSPDLLSSYEFNTEKGMRKFFSLMEAMQCQVSPKCLQWVEEHYDEVVYIEFVARVDVYEESLRLKKVDIGDYEN